MLFATTYLLNEVPYSETKLKNGSSIEIYEYEDWESSIPIFYLVRKNFFTAFESSPIFYEDPSLVMAKKINFEIIDYPDIKAFVIFNEKNPKKILGIGNYDRGVFYPAGSLFTCKDYLVLHTNECKRTGIGRSAIQ